MAGQDLPTSLEDLISLVTRIDISFPERLRETEKRRDLERPRSIPRLAPTFQYPLQLPSSSFLDNAAGNFIHSALVAKYLLPTIRLIKPLSVSSISGEIVSGLVRFITATLTLGIGVLHQETISFYVLPKSTGFMLLGLPSLRSHAPVINWS